MGFGESMVARLKLKGIDGRAPPGVASVALFDTSREELTRSRHSKEGQIDSSFLIGAWPLFAGGVTGRVNSVNGRDRYQLTNVKYVSFLNASFRDVWFQKVKHHEHDYTYTCVSSK